MASTARRWAKGCGCGCGLLLVVLGLLGWGGYLFIRNIIREAEEADAVTAKLRKQFGGVEDYRPDPNGELSPERMEVFLRARELMAEARAETERSLSLLSSDGAEGLDQVPGVIGELLEWGLGAAKVEGLRNLIPSAMDFVSARSQALLEAGMGPGEYLYIYSIAYYSWLGHSPADGPPFRLVGDSEDGDGRRQAGEDAFDVREGRREWVLSHLNEKLLPIMRRQLAALEEETAESTPWRDELAAEVAAMEADRFRIPWRDGVPERIATSLEPYRRPLESSYSALFNPLEVTVGE